MIDASKTLFGDEPFLWMGNKSLPDSTFQTDKAIRLPNVPHGFNNYADTHNIVVLSASNPKPDQFRFFKLCDMNDENIRIAIHSNVVYQAVLRTSIRTQSDHKKIILVPDYNTTLYLSNLFPGSKLLRFDVGLPERLAAKKPGRKRQYESNAEKVKAHRQRTKDRKLALQNDVYALNKKPTFPNSAGMLCNHFTNTFISDYVSQPAIGTAYSGIYSTDPLAYVAYCTDDLFMDFLLAYHEMTIKSKDDGNLISPAIFDPKKCDGTRRGRNNIVYMRGIWLDFEKGDLEPGEVHRLFPDTRMVIFNTYGHSVANPRFRVFIPTKTTMTPEVYEVIWDQIGNKIEDAGYHVRKVKKASGAKSGLDVSKRTPTSWTPPKTAGRIGD